MSKLPEISREQIAKHNNSASCWIILFSSVYDVTRFLKVHPAGEKPLLAQAGNDATQAFIEAGHLSYSYVLTMMELYRIGKVAPDAKL